MRVGPPSRLVTLSSAFFASARRHRFSLSTSFRKIAKKPTAVATSQDPAADAFAARALNEQQALKMKKRNIKIDEELQKVKTQELLYEWKEDYRTSQQQLRRKRLVKGKGNQTNISSPDNPLPPSPSRSDYQEAVVQAPFGIDPHYIAVMNKDQQEFVENAIRHEARRTRSPESAMREEEERSVTQFLSLVRSSSRFSPAGEFVIDKFRIAFAKSPAKCFDAELKLVATRWKRNVKRKWSFAR